MLLRAENTTPNKNFEQYLFVVSPEDKLVREYLNQSQINGFINSCERDAIHEEVNKDLSKFTFLNTYSEDNNLELEIRREFEQLPIVSKLMI